MVKNYIKFEISKKYYVIYVILCFTLLSYGLLFIFHRQEERSSLTYITMLEQSSNARERDMGEALHNKDYSTYLQHHIQLKEEQLKTSQKEEDIHIYQNEIAFDRYLLEHKMQPLNTSLGVEFHQLTTINGASALVVVMRIILPILLPFLSMLLIISSIKDQKKAYYYMMTLPMQRKDIIKAKWGTAILMGCVGILLFLFVAFILGITFGGVGDFTYPMVLQTSLVGQMQLQMYIPLWGFLVLSLLLIGMQITLYVSLGMFLCKFVKQYSIVYLLLVIYTFVLIKYVVSLPANQAAPISFLTFLLGGPYYIMIQGYPMFIITAYMVICIIMSCIVYTVYMSSKVKKDYFHATY